MIEESNPIILKADNLTKIYGTFRAVDGLSLSINRGEVFGFLGPNGAGKTTSIKMLCGLLKPNFGQVQINSGRASKSIGVCPQNIVIWENMTCIEQLTFLAAMYGIPHNTATIKGMELLEVLGLAPKAKSLAKTLSGGMQRRLNIALALVHDPEILILDEPQAGLDPQSRVLVRDYIRSIKSRITVILTTHDMEEAEKLSDRICIIDHGKALVSGTVEEIKRSISKESIIEVEIEGNVKTNLLSHIKNAISIVKIEDENTVALIADNPSDTVLEIMNVIKTKGIILLNFRMRNVGLEDVFIKLTGRRLRD